MGPLDETNTNSGGAWDAINQLLAGLQALTGTYSIDVNDQRIPSMVPGNTQWLTPAVKMGAMPRLNDEQIRRAIEYASRLGNAKPSGGPISPLGSEFDFFNPSAARRMDLQRLQYGRLR